MKYGFYLSIASFIISVLIGIFVSGIFFRLAAFIAVMIIAYVIAGGMEA